MSYVVVFVNDPSTSISAISKHPPRSELIDGRNEDVPGIVLVITGLSKSRGRSPSPQQL